MTRSAGNLFRRRRLLAAFLALAAVAGIPGARIAWASDSRRCDRAGLLGLFDDPESAAVVGRRYLAGHPEDRDGARIFEQLILETRAGSRGELRRRLRDRHLRDLASDSTVIVDGWVLSRTEARLFALAALLDGARRDH